MTRAFTIAVTIAFGAIAGASAAAEGPTIAVMPFRDLAHARGEVGEAIRETVTSDLRGVAGLRVIERANIDRLLGELKLQEQRSNLDPTATVKLGKLLGATLIALGAYQESGGKARLTARFVRVETGEIVGSAKVDGPPLQLLSLEDRVTGELLRSAGMAPSVVDKATHRKRRPLRTATTAVLYGRAVTEPDGDKKRTLLQLVIDDDPDFTYAAHDLDALEKRLVHYDATARVASADAVSTLQAGLSSEKDPVRIEQTYFQLFQQLQSTRRYRQLAGVARSALAMPDPPPLPPYPPLHELAAYHLVLAPTLYHDWDGTLREGERFVAAYPASQLFANVRLLMTSAIEAKRKAGDEGARDAAADVAGLAERWRDDPCLLATVYQRHSQWSDARRILQGIKPGQCKPVQYELVWFNVECGVGHFAAAATWLDKLAESEPQLARSLRTVIDVSPAD